jgi:hypothetical protein
VGRAIRPYIEALRLRYRRPIAWQAPDVHSTFEHSFRRITWRKGNVDRPIQVILTEQENRIVKALRWPVSQSQRLQAFQNIGAEINRYEPVVSISSLYLCQPRKEVRTTD